MITPSLDITRDGELTAYLDEESMWEDITKSMGLIIATECIMQILQNYYNSEEGDTAQNGQ